MPEAVLAVAGLRKSFGGVVATDGIDLDVAHGTTHAVIGPNGAGKTTLVAQLAGALRPDAGRIIFRGRDITGEPEYARAHLGIARSFQITNLLRDMSVLDNVALAVQARDGHAFRFWQPARAEERLRAPAVAILSRLGLLGRAGERAGTLSHGERRQLEIAMALACDPELLLLDEPMAGMGAEESARMVATLRTLKRERTILLVEHDMDAVFALADRITVLVYGRVIASGRPDDIRANADVRRAYLGEG